MRILFMGTPDFAAVSLKRLVEDGHEICGVFTQPDKPRNRNKVTFSPVKEYALSCGLTVYQPVKMRDGTALDIVKSLAPELIVVVAYGRILPKDILDVPPLGCVNVHASLLPKYRGAAPINWAMLNGDAETGVSIMYMAEELDAGDVIRVAKTPIDPEEDLPCLWNRLAELGADLLSKTLRRFASEGKVPAVPQNPDEVSYAPMLDKTMCPIDWNKTAQQVHNHVRGLHPWPVATMVLQGKTFKVHAAHVVSGSGTPGQILGLTKTGLTIACGEGAVEITSLQAEGGKRMAAPDYFRGHPLQH